MYVSVYDRNYTIGTTLGHEAYPALYANVTGSLLWVKGAVSLFGTHSALWRRGGIRVGGYTQNRILCVQAILPDSLDSWAAHYCYVYLRTSLWTVDDEQLMMELIYRSPILS